MKRVLIISSCLFLASCVSQIGTLTMVSTRNIDSKTEYVELRRYVVANSGTVEKSIEKAVKEVSGGEFMKNVNIYSNGKVRGDVWGVAGVLSESDKRKIEQKTEYQKRVAASDSLRKIQTYKDSVSTAQENAKFSIDDKVSWENGIGQLTMGVIVGKDDEYVVIKTTGDKLVKVKYKYLTKLK